MLNAPGQAMTPNHNRSTHQRRSADLGVLFEAINHEYLRAAQRVSFARHLARAPVSVVVDAQVCVHYPIQIHPLKIQYQPRTLRARAARCELVVRPLLVFTQEHVAMIRFAF